MRLEIPKTHFVWQILHRAAWIFASHLGQDRFVGNTTASILQFLQRFTSYAQVLQTRVNAFSIVEESACVCAGVRSAAWLRRASIRIKAGMAKWSGEAESANELISQFFTVSQSRDCSSDLWIPYSASGDRYEIGNETESEFYFQFHSTTANE